MLKHALVAALVWLTPAAHAAPTDDMFARLKAATEEAEAADVAADIWATWLESGSPTVDLLMERVGIALESGDTETAHELLDRVILLKPDYPEAYHRRAGLFLDAENYPEAFRDLNEALKLEPRHFGAWLGMGVMLEALGGEKEALESYREALAIYPLLPQARSAASRLAKKAEGQEL
ncbi:MAG: tetratricopeptide repeat protein [Acidobacteria bacterium]|nr:tetratricopeptide repeat protein [Acidobacteriota bacterium]